MSLRARWETLKFRVLGPDRYFHSVPQRRLMRAEYAASLNPEMAEALDDVLRLDQRKRVADLNDRTAQDARARRTRKAAPTVATDGISSRNEGEVLG